MAGKVIAPGRSFTVLFGLSFCCGAFAAVLEVDDGGGAFFPTIQSAIDAAVPAADSVFVHCGIYGENVVLKDRVSVIGAGPECTIIDGEAAGAAVTAVGIGPATSLAGFTLENGSGVNGGGILIEGGSPRIQGNVIRNNTASQTGGGIAIRLGSTASILNNVVAGNRAGQTGGGIQVSGSSPSLLNNTVLRNCLQAQLPACSQGGGISLSGSTAVLMVNNLVAWNESAAGGGGLHATGSAADLRNNDLFGNLPANYGGLPDLTGTDGNLAADPRLEDEIGYQPRSDSPLVDAGAAAPAPSTDLRGIPRPLDGNGSGTEEVDVGARENEGLTRLMFTDADTLVWDPSFDSQAKSNLYRGDLRVLIQSGIYNQDPLLVPGAARWCDLVTAQMTDGGVPPLNEAFFYLAVTRRFAEGPAGFDSTPAERVFSDAGRCPDLEPPAVGVNSLTTLDSTPPLTGTVNDPTASIQVTVQGNPYVGINGADGTWSLPDGAITPALAPGTYNVQAVAADPAGNQGSDVTSGELRIVNTAVIGFTLMDADADVPIGPLIDGAVLDLTVLPNISIRADCAPAVVGSVRFGLDGNADFRLENGAPYSLFGDSAGNFSPWSGVPLEGSHTLTATSYSGSGASGTTGGSLTVSFEVLGGSGGFWELRADAPIPRYEAQGLAVGSRLYVFGGFHTNSGGPKTTARSDAYDPALDDWVPLANMPEHLTHAGQAADGSTVYLAGGFVGDHPGPSTNHVWIYDTVGDGWSAGPNLPDDRGGGSLVRLGRTLHFFGGGTRTAGNASITDFGDHWVLNLGATASHADDALSWTTAASLPNPRNHLGGVSTGGLIYAVGGQHGEDEINANQAAVHAYNAGTNTWTPVASMPRPLGHIAASTFVRNGRIVVAGGVTTGSTEVADVIEYDPGTNTWIALTDLPGPRQSPVADHIAGDFVVTGGFLGSITITTWVADTVDIWEVGTSLPVTLGEVAGGIIGGRHYLVGEGNGATLGYDLATGTWTAPGSLDQRPFQGHHHAAEVFGGRLFLLGGLGGGSDGRVQIYDPVADNWTTGSNAPFLAGSSSTALIGGKIYFAGGIIGSATTSAAAVYNPQLNNWASIAPMPDGVNHAASATDGVKLYVFGGRTGGNVVGNGFNYTQIYDPGTNTWESSNDPGSTLAPLPQARGGTGKAVFFNGEFYVFGGETLTGPGATPDHVYNRVDIYNPVSNTWRTGALMPTARHGIFPVLHAGRIYVAGGGVMSGNSQSVFLEIYTPGP